MSTRNTASVAANENAPRFEVQRALVLGAVEFSEANTNDIWQAELRLHDNSRTDAIVKDIPLREVANEIFGAALAHACGLPVPRAFVAIAHPNIVPAQLGHKLANGARLLFASEQQQTPPLGRRWTGKTLPKEIVDALASWAYCGHLLAFDTWVANTDRHEHNLLFESADDIWLIDHGRCFNGVFWQPGELDPQRPYPNLMAEWLCPRLTEDQLQALRGAVLRLCERIGQLEADEIGQDTGAMNMFPVEIGEEILKFLENRLPLTPRITGALTGINGLLT